MKFKLAYCDVTVQYVSHYVMRFPLGTLATLVRECSKNKDTYLIILSEMNIGGTTVEVELSCSSSSCAESTEFLDSLAIHPYHPLLLVGLQGSILDSHKANGT